MDFDLRTGLEIELVLPAGHGRLDLASTLAERFGVHVEPFIFATKVPVPELDRSDASPEALAAATIGLIQDIAAHHQAKVQSVSPDFRFFYLAHRAARLVASDGVTRLSIVHDNTLKGGERVAELVTTPFAREELSWFTDLFGATAEIAGVSIPDEAALHVHIDGARFQDTVALARLVQLYQRCEVGLNQLTRRPPGLRRAQPLPPAFVQALAELAERSGAWPEAEVLIREHISGRGHALNLYNLAADEADKLTVELKTCGSTLVPERVAALRELFVALAHRALDSNASLELPVPAEALARALLVDAQAQALLVSPA